MSDKRSNLSVHFHFEIAVIKLVHFEINVIKQTIYFHFEINVAL
jgi:hypothetical protein